jgi:hypothetical protein
MRRNVLAMAAALVAVLAALVAPANAVADAVWPSIPCPRGALMADRSTVDPAGVVVVPGVIACGVPKPGPRFAVAVFEDDLPTGLVDISLLRDYASPKGPTRFRVVGTGEPGAFFATSLCLMTDTRTRLSCVHVSADMVVSQISTRDRRVRKPVRVQREEAEPNCGSCWRIP